MSEDESGESDDVWEQIWIMETEDELDEIDMASLADEDEDEDE